MAAKTRGARVGAEHGSGWIARYETAAAENLAQLAASYGALARPECSAREPPAAPAAVLDELARASALAEKARAHRPLLLHRAVRAGGSVSELAQATGLCRAELRAEWQSWAEQQRRLATQTSAPHAPGTFIGMSAPEYAGVAALFDGDASPPQR